MTEIAGTTGDRIAHKLGTAWTFKSIENPGPEGSVSKMLWGFFKQCGALTLQVYVSNKDVVLVLRKELNTPQSFKGHPLRVREDCINRLFKRDGSFEDDIRQALRTTLADMRGWKELLEGTE